MDIYVTTSFMLTQGNCKCGCKKLAQESVMSTFQGKARHYVVLDSPVPGADFEWDRITFGYLSFNVVYQVCSSEIEVKAKFQEQMKESLKCNLLFVQGFQAPRGQMTNLFCDLFLLL